MNAGPNYPKTILFFDGVCNLCNGFVDFLVRADRHTVIHLASLQGPTAKKLLASRLVVEMQSVVLNDDGQVFTGAEAVGRVFQKLPLPYRVLALILWVPRPMGDAIYNWVARNRYRWFGQRSTCRLPTEAEKSHFLPE